MITVCILITVIFIHYYGMAQANQPSILLVSDYIAYIKEYKNASPFTVDIFERTSIACRVQSVGTSMESVDELWKSLTNKLDSGETKRGFIVNCIILVKAMLHLHNVVTAPTYNYNLLKAKLKKSKPPLKSAYSDDDIQKIYRAVQYDHTIANAVLLMTLSGLRVGATLGLKFQDFEKVPGVENVRVFLVRSKGRTYTAAISEYGFDLLNQKNVRNRQLVVDTEITSHFVFNNRIRTGLLDCLDRENLLELIAGKSSLHSFRKFAIGKFSMSGLAPDEVSRLGGHIVRGNAITQKNYVDANSYTAEWKKYIAELYARTKMMEWKLL